MNRRSFLQTSLAAAAASVIPGSALAQRKLGPLGLQLYSVRGLIERGLRRDASESGGHRVQGSRVRRALRSVAEGREGAPRQERPDDAICARRLEHGRNEVAGDARDGEGARPAVHHRPVPSAKRSASSRTSGRTPSTSSTRPAKNARTPASSSRTTSTASSSFPRKRSAANYRTTTSSTTPTPPSSRWSSTSAGRSRPSRIPSPISIAIPDDSRSST